MRLSATVGLASAFVAGCVFGYEVQTPPLDTEWTYKVGTNPWPQYPRPLLQRPSWQTLNGVWKWRAASASEGAIPPLNETLNQDVLVPSCIESGLSGLQLLNQTYSWFTREFKVPNDWSISSGRVILNFEAVDYEATVFINGKQAAFHRGGYWHFSVDATDYLNVNGTNSLHVFVYDPTDSPGVNIPIGKQALVPSHIFYRACSGIWQTVWMEWVPETYISGVAIAAGADGRVNMTVSVNSSSSSYPESVSVSVLGADGNEITSYDGVPNEPFDFVVESPKLWSPDSPTLYNISLKLGTDEVTSYTGFRTISRGKVNGIERPLINGRFDFHFGTLDQGYWPDGLHTPPSLEAMVYDLHTLKDLGFNMLRKHIKVENQLFYQACDQLGLLLIQDMPSMKADGGIKPDAAQQAEFERQFDILIEQHKSFPSIYTWVVYNEGWGQLLDGSNPEQRLAARAKELDPTRLVDATTGWFDHGFGDYSDNHHYANPQCGTPFYSIQSSPYDPSRIAIQGEFGGIGHNVSAEHLWKVEQAIRELNQTYELDADLPAYNYRSHLLLEELRQQVEFYACSGAVWTQTTDVEGEVNGLLTYDRRILRPYEDQWKKDIEALYDTAQTRVSAKRAVILQL